MIHRDSHTGRGYGIVMRHPRYHGSLRRTDDRYRPRSFAHAGTDTAAHDATDRMTGRACDLPARE